MLPMQHRAEALRRIQNLPASHEISKLSKNLGFTDNVLNDAQLTLSVSEESTSSSIPSSATALARPTATSGFKMAPVFPVQPPPTADFEDMILGHTTEDLVQKFVEDEPVAMAGKNPVEFLRELADEKALIFGPTTDIDGDECDAQVIKVDVLKLQQICSEATLGVTPAISDEPDASAEEPIKTSEPPPESANVPAITDGTPTTSRIRRPPIGSITSNSSLMSNVKSKCQNRSFTFGGPGWVSPNDGKKFASTDVRLRNQELIKAKKAQAAKEANAKSIEREKGYDKSEAFDNHRDCLVSFGNISSSRGPMPPPAVLPALTRTNRTPMMKDSANAQASAPAPEVNTDLIDPLTLNPAPYMLTHNDENSEQGIYEVEPDFALQWDKSIGVFHQTRK